MQQLDEVRINFNEGGIMLINVCLAVIMFGVALNLTLSDFKTILKTPKPLLVGIGSQFLLLPLLTFLLVIVWQPRPSLALGMMLVAACPGGNISNFMSFLARGNAALSVGLTAFATMGAILFTPLNLAFYGNLYEPTRLILQEISVRPADLFQTIGLILGLPLLTGMFFRSRAPVLAMRISKVLKPLSIMIFIAFVLVAFLNNLDIFTVYFQAVVWLVLFHNAMALGAGYGIGKIFGLAVEDCRTLSLETGIQNSGLGLLLVFGFFNGMGGMALVAAWWGIWHILSGLSLAFFWGHSPAKIRVQ